MKLLFTKNTSVVSCLIRWGFDEPCSHFAVELYRGQIVFQSNFFGCDFQASKTFRAWQEVVHEIEFPMDQPKEDEIFDGVVNRMIGNGYDWGALAYFFWRGVLNKFLGVPLPERNAWQSKNKDLCVEAANALPDDVISAAIKSVDLSMKTPEQLYQMLLKERNERVQ